MKNSVKCDKIKDMNIRDRLKAEILTLTDEQVEYVLQRLHNERKSR